MGLYGIELVRTDRPNGTPRGTARRACYRWSMQRKLVACVVILTFVLGGCVAQQRRGGGIRMAGPGATIAGGALLGLAGGAIIYGVDTSDNSHDVKQLATEVGLVMLVIGVGAIIWGSIQLNSRYGPPPPAYGPHLRTVRRPYGSATRTVWSAARTATGTVWSAARTAGSAAGARAWILRPRQHFPAV